MSDQQEQKARILIVDDTPKNVQILGTILKQEGYRINVAGNGLHALKVVEKVSPDLILLDIMMPEMDGFETCIRLKAFQQTKDIPIIFLTARTDTDDVVRGFELGAVDYVTKPFKATELLVRVRTHLDLKLSKDLIIKASNERKELLHVLCHDLSNPFNGMISALNMIEDYSMFEEFKEHLISAAQNGLDIIQLVRNMRALEDHKLELEVINLSEAIGKSFFLLSERFSEKQIELEVNIDGYLNIIAEKASFINSVMNNIFTNALKFSYHHSKIIIDAMRAENYAEISIRDFGIGMSEKLLNDLFDVSKATSRAGTDGETGTGFGLPLIKKFINAYGGTIEIFSKQKKEHPQDHGTEIKLRLKIGPS